MQSIVVLLFLACALTEPYSAYTESDHEAGKEPAKQIVHYDSWIMKTIPAVKSTEENDKRLEILEKAIGEKPESPFIDDLILWNAIRGHITYFGSTKFLDRLQDLLGRDPKPKKPGRKRKKSRKYVMCPRTVRKTQLWNILMNREVDYEWNRFPNLC